MLDPGKNAALDQAIENLVEILPPMLYRYYRALLQQGFTEEESMTLIVHYQHETIHGSRDNADEG